ncbi:hypothetical protein Bca101_070684 [Brassica carinata]
MCTEDETAVRYCLPFVLSPSLQGGVAMAVCVHEHFSTASLVVRSEYLIGSVGSSHVEVETFLRNGHPSAFLVGNFSSYSQVPKNSTLLASFSPVSCLELVGFQSFSISVEVKSSERSLRISYFRDDMGCSGNRGNEVNATSRDYHQR